MDPSDLGMLAVLDALLQESSVTRAARRVELSTPAMSHALARLRERLADPLLVRSGRGMVLTPRAEALREPVHAVIVAAEHALVSQRPFHPSELARTFVVLASDYVLGLLGAPLDRLLARDAPLAGLRFLPNSGADPALLRDGTAELAVGIYGELPPELLRRQLLTDRFVCVVRADHPTVGKRLTREQFVALPHLQIAPRGAPGGYVDDVLASLGLQRRVARAVPYFTAALQLVAHTDYLLVVGERLARQQAPAMGLRVLEVPVPLEPYALSLLWHPRFDGDAAHRFLREAFTQAAREVAADLHPKARTRLVDNNAAGVRRRAGKAQP